MTRATQQLNNSTTRQPGTPSTIYHLPSIICHLFFLFIFVLIPAPIPAADWPQWRGPSFNGSSPETDLPVDWSRRKNVAWSAALPGPGGATPVIWKDRVFVTAVEQELLKLSALCFRRTDGKLLWNHKIGKSFPAKVHNTGASPSPVTNGKLVTFLFGTGLLSTFDMDGKLLWQQDIQKEHGPFSILFHYGASPLLYKGKLYIPVLHNDKALRKELGKPAPMSYLLCLDARTGRQLWKHHRNTDAKGESREAYTTPFPFQGLKGPRIVISGADHVTAHDPDSGKEIWRSPSWNVRDKTTWRTVASVSGNSAAVFVPVARGSSLLAVLGGGEGLLGEKHRLWTLDKNVPDAATPLVYGGKLYVQDGMHRVLSCVDPLTGQVYWREKLDENAFFFASPTGADNKIYCINMDGKIVVLAAGRTFKVLNRINMGEPTNGASIAIAGKQLFIRTSKRLYCIGK